MKKLMYTAAAVAIGVGAFLTGAHADGNPYDTAPVFSVDGKSIYFYSYRHGNGELFRMSPDGSHQTRLTETEYNEWWMWPTNDPNILLVASDKEYKERFAGSAIYKKNLHTGDMTKLIEHEDMRWLARAAMAPEVGKFLYAATDTLNPAARNELYVMDMHSGETKPYGDADDHYNTFPTITPDGSKVAYVRHSDGKWAIYLNDLSGKNERKLVEVEGTLFASRLSPNGEYVAFNAGQIVETMGENGETVREQDIFVVKTDGTGLKRLTTAVGSDHGAAWSPDSKWIYFSSYRNGPSDIFAIRPDGSDEHNVTKTSVAH